VRLLVWAIGAAAVAESAVPSAVPRMVRHVTTS
jgi:proline iminopeptidase